MLIAYIDETGDTGSLEKRGASACYGLGCLIIDADRWPEALEHMVRLRRGLRDRHGILVRRELKSTHLVSGSGALAGLELPPFVRRGIFSSHLSQVAGFGGSAVSVIVDKSRFVGQDWFHLAWETLLQRLERFIHYSSHEHMVVIHDDGENEKVRAEVRKARVYLTAGRMGGGGHFRFAAPIVEDAIPRDSASTYPLQLADMIA